MKNNKKILKRTCCDKNLVSLLKANKRFELKGKNSFQQESNFKTIQFSEMYL